MPEAFTDAESYAATKAHELTHWTAQPSRLDRVLGKRFGDDAYAAEELIAEMGAAVLLRGSRRDAGTPRGSRLLPGSPAARAEGRRAIFTAAAQAQRAVDYLQGLARPGGADEEDVPAMRADAA